jgi:hypothetical protein
MKKKRFTTPTTPALLNEELTSFTLARTWRNLEIHFIQKKTAPFVLREINRISTLMFGLNTMAGDIFDETYTYIVAYDPKESEVVSFYRYILGREAIRNLPKINLATAGYYNFSNEFLEKILPFTIELGMSVVNKFAKAAQDGLEAVWKGLGILVYEYHTKPQDIKIEYFFGKFSIQHGVYDDVSHNMIHYLFHKHFPPMVGDDKEVYVKSKEVCRVNLNFALVQEQLSSEEYKIDRKTLLNYLKSIEKSIPKLAEVYASLGGLRSFDTIVNHQLKSNETAILQRIDKIDPFYIKRFLDGYETSNPRLFRK